MIPGILRRSLLRAKGLLKKGPYLYIFHHIPKCGGNSVKRALSGWFICIADYKMNVTIEDFKNTSINLKKLTPYHILCGHFEDDGCYLFQRYPKVINNPRFRLISFVRDPLELQISLYYYEKKIRTSPKGNMLLEDRILMKANYMGNIFVCDELNYKEVLDRYYFIGVTEYLQESLDKLACKLGKPKTKVPLLNKTERDDQLLSEDVIQRFKEKNRLDYLIYEHCKSRLFRAE